MNRYEFQDVVDSIMGKTEYVPGVRANSKARIKGKDPYFSHCSKITATWETGGVSGGSCWDDSDPVEYSTSELEPDFHHLDEILSKVASNVTFLEYKTLMKLVKYGTYIENEYYGNCTYYATKTITIDDIWDFLVAQKHV
jgi:hypothetical protein